MSKEAGVDLRMVAVEKSLTFEYPPAPFDPDATFEELRMLPLVTGTNPTNRVYRSVRAVLERLGLDFDRVGTAEWRPFRALVKPGQRIVIKPNFVKGSHPLGQIGVHSMITHAAVLRPLIDYVLLSTAGDCSITICDVPLQSSDWNEIVTRSGAQALVDYYSRHGI